MLQRLMPKVSLAPGVATPGVAPAGNRTPERSPFAAAHYGEPCYPDRVIPTGSYRREEGLKASELKKIPPYRFQVAKEGV